MLSRAAVRSAVSVIPAYLARSAARRAPFDWAAALKLPLL
jgi:hypothetical protein